MEVVWHGAAVEEANLSVQISMLRRILDRGRRKGSYIQTVFGRGYRLVSEVGSTNTKSSLDKTSYPGRDAANYLSVSVLPFGNLSTDPTLQHFALGITEDLIIDLHRTRILQVMSRNSTHALHDGARGALNANYVIEGSIAPTDDGVCLNVRLIEADTDLNVWADHIHSELSTSASTRNEISRRIARRMNVELLAAIGRRMEREGYSDADAHHLALRGWVWYHRPRSLLTLEEARRAFATALDADSSSIDGAVGLGATLTAQVLNGWSDTPLDDRARAERLLLRALESDPDLAMAHHAIGALRRSQNRLADAYIEFKTAIALDPSYAPAYSQLGQTLMYLGQPEAGISSIENAIRLNPREPYLGDYLWALGSCHFLAGHGAKALDLLREASVANPRYWYVHLWVAAALAFNEELEAAEAALAMGIELKPDINTIAAWRRYCSWTMHPRYVELATNTVYRGLQLAGMATN
jgi:TolB-like protein/Flp pilus assembly protein TadD